MAMDSLNMPRSTIRANVLRWVVEEASKQRSTTLRDDYLSFDLPVSSPIHLGDFSDWSHA